MSEQNNRLEELIDLLRRERGDCPDSHTLVAFHRGGLEGAAQVRIGRHVDLCGLCQALLKVVQDLQAARRGEEVGEPPDWEAIESSLRQRVLDITPARRRPRGPFERFSRSLKGFFWQPAVAYLFALVLLYPAFQGTFSERRPSPPREESPSPPVQGGTTRMVSLERSDLRGAESKANVVKFASADRFATLQFFVPIRVVPGIRYSASIKGPRGLALTVDTITSADGLGNFALVCPREVLVAGSQVLVVEELDRETGRQTATFSFPFEVVE